jgi:Ni/Co efflux regulator RcnB
MIEPSFVPGFAKAQLRGQSFTNYHGSDSMAFALEVPPAGYEWVRVGSDALLIDTNTGEILQTEYGVFG